MSAKTLYKPNSESKVYANKIFTTPSFYAHVISGLLIAYSIYLYLTIGKLSPWENLMGLVGIAIAIGLHGQAHLLMEVHYQFNPFEYIFTN